MVVHDRVLTSGNYLYDQKVSHGPMEYHCDDADYGCLVFASFVGGSPAHDWNKDHKE
jgi:hypothetical protein